MTVSASQNETTYSPVHHKKSQGRLILMYDRMIFNNGHSIEIYWANVEKHQVSPPKYPKALLKIVLVDSNLTFQLSDRAELEKIRKDITNRLKTHRGVSKPATSTNLTRKRSFSQANVPFDQLDANALAVSRSTILASNPALRQQHQSLVVEEKTLSEEDFWETHRDLLEEEYARIAGIAKAGTSSVLQCHLPASGKVTLGVEEMRQIFILYPAVHKAYEDKVPLELSDEQFWRKYLESEFFHRDRGKIGSTARNHDDKKAKISTEQQEARAAAVGTDDMFSRYDQKLREKQTESTDGRKQWGQRLAVGQFDLASTFATERGSLLEGPRDNHPANQTDDGKGARVIKKYNRHWAMVLHPEEAVAGANLMEVARKSTKDRLIQGTTNLGPDSDMRLLVEYLEDDAEEELTLRNVEAYYAGQLKADSSGETDEEASKKHALFAQAMKTKLESKMNSMSSGVPSALSADSCFPSSDLARQLLSALTQKMAKDSQTEASSTKMMDLIPADFKSKLQKFFRRTSELLRHFYTLRKLDHDGSAQKLAKIVEAMENVYREVETTRRDIPQSDIGHIMSKMSLSIMDSLDWAFKLHREGAGGGGGGFVSVN